MAFTEFYAQTTGSNLNAGSTTTDAATFTYASGSWVQSTGVFTVASGDPATDGVAVGDWASVYPDGSSVGVFVGRVIARDATTITVSLTAKSGTAPTDGTNNRTLKIGGAWKGPNAAEAFPFGFVQSTMTNASGDIPRVNLKTGTNYSITAAMTHANNGPMRFEGYTSSTGDGGRAIIDGGTSGTSYVLLTCSATHVVLRSLIFQNNGATGSSAGLVISGARSLATSCVVNSVRGHGFSLTGAGASTRECEAYTCNQSNTANTAGFSLGNTGGGAIRCISHDNSGSNSKGFFSSNTENYLIDCIADTNGSDGFASAVSFAQSFFFFGCEFYNNAGDGIEVNNSTGSVMLIVENCNFIKNGGWGLLGSGTAAKTGIIRNCGFGTGTQANTSGNISAMGGVEELGSVNYATDATPWVDPANGDFRINLAAAKGTGRGAFTQTASSYAGTVAYPDIGAAQHFDDGNNGNNGRNGINVIDNGSGGTITSIDNILD